jgi:predicted dehydrogenase
MAVYPENKIRLGIIGCGLVAEERHMPALKYHPVLQVIAAADNDGSRVNHISDRYGIPHRYTDYRGLLDRTDIDAVGVLTPTSSHAEISLAALKSGRHLLVEKPLALDPAACDAMISAHKKSDCKVVVGFNLRWHRLITRARQYIRSGRLGEIKAIRSVYTHYRLGKDAPDWHRKQHLGGGITFNESIHHFDLWRYLLDSEVEEVCSLNRPSSYYEDETQVTQAVLSNGVFATGVFTFTTSPNSEIEIYGEKGRLHLSLYRFDGFNFFPWNTYPGDILDRFKKTVTSLRDLPRIIPIIRKGGDFPLTFNNLWQHFADCIIRDKISVCSLEDGKRAIQIALSALESAKLNMPRRVKI